MSSTTQVRPGRKPAPKKTAVAAVAPTAPAVIPTPRTAAIQPGSTSKLGMLRGASKALFKPGPVVDELGHLAMDALRILRGTTDLLPSPKDKRFADPTWSDHPLYRRGAQGYIACTQSLTRLTEAMEGSGADWRDVERARFLAALLVGAVAPTNFLIGNPAALKRAFETGGTSLLRGALAMAWDLRHNGGLPIQTDRDAFTVGEDLAITPGAVIDRDEVAELIQFAPTTPQVKTRPLVLIPPPIGRYYFLDLRPGRSFVEHALANGIQVFVLSWRNPQAEQADWGIDTYAQRVLDAIATVKAITGAADVNTLGFCAGGLIQTVVLNQDAAVNPPESRLIHSSAFAVTLMDFAERAPIGAFAAAGLLKLASHGSRRKGVITARSLGTVFSAMRPDDLIFKYVVNNWLLGNDAPVFDILAWNADGTNLPARLHGEFLEAFLANSLVGDGELIVLGNPVHLDQITVDTFVTGASTDHLTPWKGCYRTTQLLGGDSTFVLSNGGHVASLVNPPGNPKASFHEGGPASPDAAEWLAGATRRTGSWWEAWSDWILPRAGDHKAAPTSVGAPGFPVLEASPGSYVHDRVPTR